MFEMAPKARSLFRALLTLSGIVMIIAGVLIMTEIVFSIDNNMLFGGILILIGFVDLVLSWFVFRKH